MLEINANSSIIDDPLQRILQKRQPARWRDVLSIPAVTGPTPDVSAAVEVAAAPPLMPKSSRIKVVSKPT